MWTREDDTAMSDLIAKHGVVRIVDALIADVRRVGGRTAGARQVAAVLNAAARELRELAIPDDGEPAISENLVEMIG